MNFADRLHAAIVRKGTPAIVGLDPRWDQLPSDVVQRASQHADASIRQAAGFEEFCLRVISAVAPLVPAVKPQVAFFEEAGPAGLAALARVIHAARQAGLIVICDAKRGDIGSTAEAYARAYLAGEDASAAPWAGDALTVNPYLGLDALEPFIEVAVERGAGIYVLVRTSNPGARDFQDLRSDGRPLYEHVAAAVEGLAAKTRGQTSFGAVGAVIGATYPRELAELRQILPSAPLLIPGYGAQGGTAGDLASAFTPDGLGAVVNNSRGILYAFRRADYIDRFAPHDWEGAVVAATQEMIADLRMHTPAGRLVP